MSNPVRPRLLVSVRDVGECVAALLGGAEIIDVKEPSRGPLGMADLSVIRAIAERMGSQESIPGLSVALGELSEWSIDRPIPALPPAVKWAKLGFAGTSASTDWRQRWQEVRRSFDLAANRQLRWIAVAYGDAPSANSPSVRHILDAAVASSSSGLLIDTFNKSSGSLLNCLHPIELLDVVRRARESQMPLAIAGKISPEDLECLCDLEPDIIGVRSAVCESGDRSKRVMASGVAKLREQLQLVWVRS